MGTNRALPRTIGSQVSIAVDILWLLPRLTNSARDDEASARRIQQK